MADHSTRIAEIDAVLASGITQVAVDGVMTSFSLAELRKERDRLKADDDSQKSNRPRAVAIDLSNLF